MQRKQERPKTGERISHGGFKKGNGSKKTLGNKPKTKKRDFSHRMGVQGTINWPEHHSN